MVRTFPALPLLFVTAIWGGWLQSPTVADSRDQRQLDGSRGLKRGVHAQGNRVSYGNFAVDKFHRLQVSVGSSSLVSNYRECALSCVNNPPCSSFNVASSPRSDGKYQCELLNEDKYSANPGQLVSSQKYHHYSIKTPCSSFPCKNGAKCVPNYGENEYHCDCVPGYTGKYCESDINGCASDPCLNGATCVQQVNGYVCNCQPGYTGVNCQTDIDECASKPCQNNGSCIDGVNGFTCSCVAGFTGENCETDIYECASNPCQNQGSCIDGVNGYTCNCNAGFTGTHCETDIDECVTAAEHKCDANADCFNTHGSYNCSCKSGYAGDGFNCSDIDECAEPTPICDVNAVCNNTLGAYNCSCKPGYTGDGHSCTDIDECASNPCQNNGSCIDGVNGYNCSCVAGFNGRNCETDIDECASKPCKNQGTCIDGVNEYTCNCNAGFTGTYCETADVCQNYQTLSDAGRKETYETVSYQCDYNLNGWYRFQGAAGTRMATSCPSEERCDTTSPGWLDGAHPTVAEGTVTRKVCFHKFGGCCGKIALIQVKNCGSYYIYNLRGTPGCDMRYCGSD
ncbi:hypothetical protein ACROYT_G032487 [Oculina patagonica]